MSKLLDPVMFADDTNLFFSHHDIKTAFPAVSNELSRIRQWFIANKLSLNAKKFKYTFFHKNSAKDNPVGKYWSLGHPEDAPLQRPQDVL